MSSIRNIVKESVGLEIFTPDNHLTPIFRYRQYDRLAKPGFSRIMPYIENAGIPFKTSIRVTLAEFQDVMSQDNIPFHIKLTILYRFDPTNSPANVIAQFAIVPDKVLENIVKDYTNQGLRRLAARYTAEKLSGNHAMLEIERDLNRHLNAQLRILGLQLLPRDSVLIREALPPEKFRQTMLDLNTHQATLRLLASFNHPTLISQALQTKFINGLDNFDGNMLLVPNMDVMPKVQQADQIDRLFQNSNESYPFHFGH